MDILPEDRKWRLYENVLNTFLEKGRPWKPREFFQTLTGLLILWWHCKAGLGPVRAGHGFCMRKSALQPWKACTSGDPAVGVDSLFVRKWGGKSIMGCDQRPESSLQGRHRALEALLRRWAQEIPQGCWVCWGSSWPLLCPPEFSLPFGVLSKPCGAVFSFSKESNFSQVIEDLW